MHETLVIDLALNFLQSKGSFPLGIKAIAFHFFWLVIKELHYVVLWFGSHIYCLWGSNNSLSISLILKHYLNSLFFFINL